MTRRVATNRTGSAWYRHAWPWFFATLLVTAVAGSIYTISLSLDNEPESVPGAQRTGLIISGATIPTSAELHLNEQSLTVSLPEDVHHPASVHLILVREAGVSRLILEWQEPAGVYAGRQKGGFADVTEYRLQATDGAWSLSASPVPGRRTLILEAADTQR